MFLLLILRQEWGVMSNFKVCDFGYVLFDDELLQCVFAESLLAEKAVLNCMAEGGNKLSCKSLRDEDYKILCRLPLSSDVMEVVAEKRQHLLDKVGDLEAEMKENDDLIIEFKGMIKDAEQRYDEVILNEDQEAQYALDIQIKEWSDNIKSLNKRVKPFNRVIKKIREMLLVVGGMEVNIKTRLIQKDADEAELVFLDQLNGFSKHFIAFLRVGQKTGNYPKYSGKNVLSHIYGVLDRSHKEMNWVKK